MKYKVTNIGAQIKSLNTRTEIWERGLRAFVHKPVLGYGAGTFEYPYRKYYDGSFGTKYAHSMIIKTIVELGIVGIICWIFYLIGCFIWIRNVFPDRKNVHVILAFYRFSLVDNFIRYASPYYYFHSLYEFAHSANYGTGCTSGNIRESKKDGFCFSWDNNNSFVLFYVFFLFYTKDQPFL